LFRVQSGDLVHGSIAGEVIESNNQEKCDISQAPLGSWLGGFGVSGLTAYFALTEECKPQPGQTVLVTGVAGAVGSMAGQIAKLAGARTIGITSSGVKCEWLTKTLGYDVAINYNDKNWYEQLVAAAPERLDVIFDNVGGNLIDESLRLTDGVRVKGQSKAREARPYSDPLL